MTRGIVLMFLLGCSQKETNGSGVDGSLGGADVSPVGDQLRIDVYPSETGSLLMKQTWIADIADGLESVEIALAPSITVSGQVLGYAVNPLHSEVPGEGRVPVPATVRVERAGTITGGSTRTDADGNFELRIPAAKGYTISITPDDGARLPFYVLDKEDLDDDVDFGTVDLGYGLPVYGHIRSHAEEGIEGAVVRLRDSATGVPGPATETDSTGHYLLRAGAGDYTLEVSGQPGSIVPSLSLSAKVGETGLSLDVDLGDLVPALISGRLVAGSDEAALRDIRVRLESRSLRTAAGKLTIETETDGDGLFGRQILSGEWQASFIPPYDSIYAGVSERVDVSPGLGFVDLGTVPLPERVEFEGFITDPTGEPVPNVAINVQEENFDRYIFSSTTDEGGGFSVEIPPGPMTLTASPPDSRLAVTQWSFDPTEAGQVFALDEGDEMSGIILGPSGRVPFALVEVRSVDGSLLATTLSDDNGQFMVSISPR